MTLKDDLVTTINNSHQRIWRDFFNVKSNAKLFGLDPVATAKWKTPGEPALVYGLVQNHVLNAIARTIKKNLAVTNPPSSTIISSVFVHQKPKVRFSGGEAEIGDLLLVRQHFQNGQLSSQNKAVLLQAKMAARPRTGILKNNELVQFDLYNGWTHPFSFPNKEVVGRTDWNFSLRPSPNLSESGVYALGYKHKDLTAKNFGFPDSCAWAVGKLPGIGAQPQIDASTHSLATVLEEFVSGRYGREWSPASAGKGDHWSDFVFQILVKSAKWVTQLQRIQLTNIPRRRPDIRMLQQVAPAFQMAMNSDDGFGGHTDERREYLKHICERLGKWSDAAGLGSFDPPPLEAEGIAGASKGMSILYVGTFGDMPLGDKH